MGASRSHMHDQRLHSLHVGGAVAVVVGVAISTTSSSFRCKAELFSSSFRTSLLAASVRLLAASTWAQSLSQCLRSSDNATCKSSILWLLCRSLSSWARRISFLASATANSALIESMVRPLSLRPKPRKSPRSLSIRSRTPKKGRRLRATAIVVTNWHPAMHNSSAEF